MSDDPLLGRFEPRPATRIGLEKRANGSIVPTPTGDTDESLVWAVDTRHLPLYWFPRDCPRGCFWARPETSDADVDRFLGGDRSRRAHAVEAAWLERLRAARIHAYRMPDATFRAHATVGGYWVSERAVEAVEHVEFRELDRCHAEAGIELRIVDDLWSLWDDIVASSLEFSGIRLRNAAARR